jgi:hypothetical protein
LRFGFQRKIQKLPLAWWKTGRFGGNAAPIAGFFKFASIENTHLNDSVLQIKKDWQN